MKTALLAIAAALTLCWLGPTLLDGAADLQAVEVQSKALAADLIADRKQRAAQAMCTSDHGQNVEAVWIDTATVECVSTQGSRIYALAEEQ